MVDSKQDMKTEPYTYVINDQGAIAVISRQWLPKDIADKLCEKLQKEVKFNTYKIQIYGKTIDQPRRQYACGDPDNKFHHYSGTSIELNEWIPELKEIRDRLTKETGSKLNSCLINEYATGKQYIGYHSDREASGINDTVMIVSLGGPRDFCFKRKSDSSVIKLSLNSGDALIMTGKCQHLYQHTVPKRAYANYRISLSYRNLST